MCLANRWVALCAIGVIGLLSFAAPALAQNPTSATGTQPKAPVAAQTTAPAKAVAPTKAVKHVKHVKKHKRHAHHVRGKHGKFARAHRAPSKVFGQASKARTMPAPRTGTQG